MFVPLPAGKKGAQYLKTPTQFIKENGITHYDMVSILCDVPTLLNEHRYQFATDAPDWYSANRIPPWVQFPVALKNGNNGICYYVYHFSNSHINNTTVKRDTEKKLKRFVEKHHLKAYVFKEGWLSSDMSTVILCRQSDSVLGLETEPDWYFEQSVESNSGNMKEQQKMNRESKEFVENIGGMKIYTAKRKEEMKKDNHMDPSCDLDVLGQKIKCKLAELSQTYRFVASSHFRIIAEIAGKYSELSDEICVSEEEMQKMKSELEAARQALSLAEKFKNLPERLVDKNGI